MAHQYTLSDIFKHEDTTRYFCNSESGFNLSVPELIHLASLEPFFDSDYVEYIIFRRLHQLAEYISEKSKKRGYQINVRHNQNLKEDLENNNASREYYERWADQYGYTLDTLDDTYYVIDSAVTDNNWAFLYYLYLKEEEGLYDLLNAQKNKIKDRKFFIVQ